MQIRGFEFLKRRNLGNFEHEDIKVDVVVGEGEDAGQVAMGAIQFVTDLLYRRIQPSTNQTTMDLGNGSSVVVKEQTTNAKVKTEAAKPAPVKEEVKVEAKEETKAAPAKETKAKAKTEAKVETKEEAPAKEEKKSKRLSTKEVNYDRGNDVHKNLLSTYLDDIYMGWNKGANLAKASKASRELDGTPFLDSEGNILHSFKEAFASYMK